MTYLRNVSVFLVVFSFLSASTSKAAVSPEMVVAVIQGVQAGFGMAKNLVSYLNELRKTTREAGIIRAPRRDSVAIFERTLPKGGKDVGIIHLKAIDSYRKDYLLLATTDADRDALMAVVKRDDTEGIQMLERIADSDRFKNPRLVRNLFPDFKLQAPLSQHHVVIKGKPEKTGELSPLAFSGFPGLVQFFLPVNKTNELATKLVTISSAQDFSAMLEENSELIHGEWFAIKPIGRKDITVYIILRDWVAKKAVVEADGDKVKIEDLFEKFENTVQALDKIKEHVKPKKDEDSDEEDESSKSFHFIRAPISLHDKDEKISPLRQ